MCRVKIVGFAVLLTSIVAAGCAKHKGSPHGDEGSVETATGTGTESASRTDTSTSAGVTSATETSETNSTFEIVSTAEDAAVEAGAGLHWFQTCGDPVCRDETRDSGVTGCSARMTEGATCSKAGVKCDAHLGCGALLICATEDPRQAPGGCPISRARFKRHVEYVTDAQREALARQVFELPLAMYTYRQDPDQQPQLGFILEDVEPSVVVDSKRDQVNLYAYTSSVVAALQEQQKEIERLREQVQQLEMRASTVHGKSECSQEGNE